MHALFVFVSIFNTVKGLRLQPLRSIFFQFFALLPFFIFPFPIPLHYPIPLLAPRSLYPLNIRMCCLISCRRLWYHIEESRRRKVEKSKTLGTIELKSPHAPPLLSLTGTSFIDHHHHFPPRWARSRVGNPTIRINMAHFWAFLRPSRTMAFSVNKKERIFVGGRIIDESSFGVSLLKR